MYLGIKTRGDKKGPVMSIKGFAPEWWFLHHFICRDQFVVNISQTLNCMFNHILKTETVQHCYYTQWHNQVQLYIILWAEIIFIFHLVNCYFEGKVVDQGWEKKLFWVTENSRKKYLLWFQGENSIRLNAYLK